jgi:hypothetical protein
MEQMEQHEHRFSHPTAHAQRSCDGFGGTAFRSFLERFGHRFVLFLFISELFWQIFEDEFVLLQPSMMHYTS